MSDSLHVWAVRDTSGLDDLSKRLTELTKLGQSEAVKEALKSAGVVVVEEVSSLARQKAKSHPRGQLADAVTAENPRIGAWGAILPFGWEKAPMKLTQWGGKSRRWRRSKGNSGGFVDVRGRFRRVSTVADYARILEYSDKRQLRHMEEGFDSAEKEALDVLEKAIDKEIKRIMG